MAPKRRKEHLRSSELLAFVEAMIRTFRSPAALFIVGTMAILAIATIAVRTTTFAAHPDVLAWGLVFDLTLTIPLLFYVFVVRPGHARAATTGVVFIACWFIAALIIPASQHQFIRDLRFVTIALEAPLVVVITRRLLTLRRAKTEGDAVQRIEALCVALFGQTLVAQVVASELAVLYYALFTWRRQLHRDANTVTVYQRSGWGSILAGIMVLLVAESIGLHLLIQMKSVIAAWVMTGLDIWGALWLLGDYQALRLRPIVVETDVVRFRYGMRWQADIPLAQIASIDRISRQEDWKRRDVLKVAMLDEPTHLISLNEPVRFRGLAGLHKTVRAIAILPDDTEIFEAAFPRARQ